MSDWDTDFDAASYGDLVWVTTESGGVFTWKNLGVKPERFIAWKPIETPEPFPLFYAPKKPKQLTPDDFFGGSSQVEKKIDIQAVEKRTREIVAWEQKYEVEK